MISYTYMVVVNEIERSVFASLKSLRDLLASFDIIMATTSVCGLLSSWCPEYKTASPVACVVLSVEIHRVSLNPSISILYIFILLAMIAALPLWYMVFTYQVPSMDVDLGVRRLFGFAALLPLSLQCVISFVVEETLSAESLNVVLVFL